MNNTTLDIDSILNFGGVETWIRLIGFYITLAGILSTLGNATIISATLKDPDMSDSRFYAIVRYLCFCRIVTCLQMLIMGVFNCLRAAKLASVVQPYWTCVCIYFWLEFGLVIEMCLLIFLALDRIIAVAFPVQYWTLSVRQADVVCLSLFLFCFSIRIGPTFFVQTWSSPTICANVFSTGNDKLNFIGQTTDNVLLGLLICLYLALLIYVRYRSLRAPNTEAEKQSIDRHLTLVPILRNQVFLHCGIQATSKTILLLAQVVTDPSVVGRLIAYGGTLVTVDMFVNTLVLLLNREIRSQWPKWFCKTNTIKPKMTMATGVSGGQNGMTAMTSVTNVTRMYGKA